MSHLRDRRRVALQVMYQLDNGGFDPDDASTRASMIESLSETGSPRSLDAGILMATQAWTFHEAADAAIEPLTPDWPLKRQPVIDRNLLRLAWYELNQTVTPPKVVISESVDLAREFSTSKSPAFINGVLDRLYHDATPTRDPSA